MADDHPAEEAPSQIDVAEELHLHFTVSQRYSAFLPLLADMVLTVHYLLCVLEILFLRKEHDRAEVL